MSGGTGEQNDMPEHEVDYSGGGSVVPTSGASSNFD